MAKLNDTQLVLLSAAAQRDDHSIYPLPTTLEGGAGRAAKAMADLAKQGLAEERETSEAASVHRVDGDLSYGMFITEAGIKAIDAGGEHGSELPATLLAPKPQHQSKTAAVITLLQRDDGATLAELIGTTGWLPHTTRAALTGLRKKGHEIERTKRGTDTCYRIVEVA